MAKYSSVTGGNSRPGLNAPNAALIAVPMVVDLAALTTALVADDFVVIGKLPADHVIVDMILDNEAIASAVVDLGLVNETDDDSGAEFMTGVALTAASLVRSDVPGASSIAHDDAVEREVALKFTAAPGAMAGVVCVTCLMRASHYGK